MRRQSTLKGPQGIETILLVEDEEVMRTLVTEVLSSSGYKVLTAEDGEQAMKIFSRFHSDIALVLSDIRLPKLGGDRMLKIMKRIDPRVPVVFETGYLNGQMKDRLRMAGARGFIQKPGVPADIIATIREVLLDRR